MACNRGHTHLLVFAHMHAASYYISFTELHACAATDQGVAFI